MLTSRNPIGLQSFAASISHGAFYSSDGNDCYEFLTPTEPRPFVITHNGVILAKQEDRYV